MLRRDARESTRLLSATVVAMAVVGLLFWARTVFVPLALAVFLAFILGPIVNQLRRWQLPRLPAVLLSVAMALIVAVSFAWLIYWQVSALIQELPDHTGKVVAKLESLRSWIEPQSGGRFDRMIKEVERTFRPKGPATVQTTEPVPVVIESRRPIWLGQLESLVSPATEVAAQGALSFLLVVFLLLGREDMRNRIIRLIGPHHLTATTRAVDDAVGRISRFLRVQLCVNAAFGAVLAIALYCIGVQYALLWGFIAGLLRYIPYVGTWIGFAPPFVAAVAMSQGWYQPTAVIALYVTIEATFAGAVEPRFFGKSLGLSEVALVLSAAFWAFLWGPIGLILSGPMTACLLVLGKHVPQLQWIDVLLGDEESLTVDVRFFQRLAARDRDEAEIIADEFVESHSATDAINSLIIPALGRLQVALDRHEISDDDADAMVAITRQIANDINGAEMESSSPNDDPPVPVLALAAHGAADQLALELLTARLDPGDWNVQQLNEGSLASEMVGALHRNNPAVVVVVSLAPNGFPHARYLSKRLRNASSDVKLLVCRWGDPGTFATEREELVKLGVDEVGGTLPSTINLLNSWQGMLAKLPPISAARPNNSSISEIGTASAL